jgi:hypothetical protein
LFVDYIHRETGDKQTPRQASPHALASIHATDPQKLSAIQGITDNDYSGATRLKLRFTVVAVHGGGEKRG